MTTSPIASARRNTELGLIVMAAVITGAAYVLASLAQDATIPARLVPFLLITLGLLLVAHLANRWLARGADPQLLPLAAVLHGIGYVMIARLDQDLAGLQAVWTVVGVAGYIAVLVLVPDTRRLARWNWWFLWLAIALLLLPLVPGIGSTVGGARIWVSLGPVNFQPGEFAKVLLALFFAGYLADKREVITEGVRIGPIRLPELRHLLPIAFAWGVAVMIMVAQKDLGSSLLFFTLFVVMLWVSTGRAGYLVAGLALFSIAAVAAWRMFDHVQTRVDIWLDPWSRYEGRGYQPVQAMFAFANGGVGGTGLGLGSPNKIPEAQNDFIFAAIGEELGLVGATGVLIAFLFLIGAGLRVAQRSERPYETLLATGLTTILGVQAFIIIGGVVRLVPLTGITLPFVSYGGSSLVANYVLLAFLVRMSDMTARRLGETPDDLSIGERVERWQARRRQQRQPVAAPQEVGV